MKSSWARARERPRASISRRSSSARGSSRRCCGSTTTSGRLAHDPVGWCGEAAERLADEAGTDRGAERLLRQTVFLQEAFRLFDARVEALDGLDDRGLRAALPRCARPWGDRHVVISVADHHADPNGLWPVDLQLIADAPGVERIDVVATRRVAESLFPRLRRVWTTATDVLVPRQRPGETRLETTSDNRPWIACRDRDDEVLAFARRLKVLQPTDASTIALVYRRPLPYIYAAQFVLDAAGIPYQASGTLPLAAEPWAASLDLLMDAVLSGFTRTALVTLLRSPHVLVRHTDGRPVVASDVAAFDRWLARHRYLGTLDHLEQLRLAASDQVGGDRVARSVAGAVGAWLGGLTVLQASAPGRDHVRALRAAWRACERLPHEDDPEASRTRRTRAALDHLLDQLEDALDRHDTTPVKARDTCTLIRRWIEERTFALPRADEGVHLLDADAAPYGLFDHVRIVGLLEGEWPEPSAREIFYPAFMLERLDWAEERTRTGTLRARFADLLALPSVSVGVSVPELDQDAVVRPSSLLDELLAFGADRRTAVPADERALPVTREDALLATPAVPLAPVFDAAAQDWAAWRLSRPARTDAGRTTALPGRAYGVTGVETYLQCPFRYFASRVLGLEEEAEDEPGLPARDAGLLLHDVLHDCFLEWQRLGRGAIGPDQLPEAREVFGAVADRALRALPPADRAVERVRLFGSAIATGVIEKMLRVEVESFGDVARRALEHPIDRTVTLPAADGTRAVHVRGRVDRVDWTTDGTVRIVDYKTGRRPSQALQPGVYAHAVVQEERERGREVGIAPSGFVAFREDVPWIQAVSGPPDADDQARAFVEAVDAIESGAFPVRPHNPFRCQFCHYPSVCRKDDIDDA